MNLPQPKSDPTIELLRSEGELPSPAAEQARALFLQRVDQELAKQSTQVPFFQRLLSPISRAFPWNNPVRAGGWALALTALVLALVYAWPASRLTYEVAGARVDGGFINATEGRGADVHFSDATHLSVAPGARLRVVELQENGALVSLEEGELDVTVTHTGSAAWNFAAGPFNIRVTGTKFTLNYWPASERVRVRMEQGSVEVSGYAGFSPVRLAAGQEFIGDGSERTMRVGQVGDFTQLDLSDTDEPISEATLGEPSKSLDEPALADERRVSNPSAGGVSESDASGANQSAPGKDAKLKQPQGAASQPAAKAGAQKGGSRAPEWATLVKQGSYTEVVAAATQRGLSSCLQQCGAEDLSALAEAARYTGMSALSEQALTALRNRFSGATRARAHFLLGRLYETRGDWGQARTSYDAVLKNSGAGAYASESLAGKMRAVAALSGRPAARSLAEEYLLRYPDGVHAATAKKFLQP